MLNVKMLIQIQNRLSGHCKSNLYKNIFSSLQKVVGKNRVRTSTSTEDRPSHIQVLQKTLHTNTGIHWCTFTPSRL